MANFMKFKQGRVWFQRRKFAAFQLLLPYGMTGITDPVGNLVAFREPSAEKRGLSVITDVSRAEAGLPQFQLDTRLQRTKNFLFGLKECAAQYQCHLGTCDRPDNYASSAIVMHWERARRGDLAVDRTAIIEGDNNPIAMTSPFVAEIGPLMFDMNTKFVSARTVLETEAFTGISFLGSECLEDCRSQEDAGENGYAASTAKVGSAGNKSDVWFTSNSGETWAKTSNGSPFIAGMDMSDILVIGTKRNHRVIIANGTTQVAAHAQIAYADVTTIGVTPTWITVNVGAINGQYITSLLYVDWMHIYASTDDGYIYKSEDGGASWTASFTTGSVDINKMSGLGNGIIWAAGNSNLLVYTEDFGVSWTVVAGPSGGVGDDNTAVLVTPDGTIFVGNNAGELYGSENDGMDWTTLSAQGVTPTSIVDIKCWGDSDIWLVVDIAGSQSRVLRSIDGGAFFRLWSLGLPINSGINDLFVVDPNIVFVAGDPQGSYGFISKTTSQLIGL